MEIVALNNHKAFASPEIMHAATGEWLESMAQGKKLSEEKIVHKDRFNPFRPGHGKGVILANSNPFKNPQNTSPTDTYDKNSKNGADEADKKAGVSDPSKRPPMTIHEGIQTVLNIARAGSGYNPLDQPTKENPNAKGNVAHFYDFVDRINEAPFLTLEFGGSKNVVQSSHNADELINSFVGTFEGVTQKDINGIIKSLKTLVSAALSYSEATESQSNFVQAICDQDENGNVTAAIYGSVFSIYVERHKGTITYVTAYQLNQVKWSLSPQMWTDTLRNKVQDQLNQSTEDWLNHNTTKSNPNPMFDAEKLCAALRIS